ncbi:protein-disulfide reductase DsbD [Thorsellia anophelis]|uniref:Thiol:disulfide interchange protein DsbD n=1 Tax=Thorsellia anophelis DSM 18579 TaxID=1123402 RepID=A0A1I0E9L1_9GAMM|nr:protein-disulfide reductase DsbD [Thorsellia anophelis]SET41852.1 Thiol:disulfide interchange protein DsbD [Thorsellia anophelis DSM 18579]
MLLSQSSLSERIYAYLLHKRIVIACFLSLLIGLLSVSHSVEANLFGNTKGNGQDVLSANQAFVLDFTQKNESLVLTWAISPGYYLYQDKFEIKAKDSRVSDITFPISMSHVDEFFGEVQIYRDQVSLPLTIYETGDNPSLSITFQGCADRGICYPPKKIDIPLKLLDRPLDSASVIGETKTEIDSSLLEESQVDQLQNKISDQAGELSFSVWWAFFLGLGVAFTPCVLPMYPLMVGLIAGRKNSQSTTKIGLLVFSYIQGMALSYTILGVIVALAGIKFQAALQHPILLGSIAILFLILAGSMFGFYQLNMPSSIQTKLVNWSNQQKSGSFIGVFFMGAIAGLLCSPCTTAPLSAILLYIAKSNDIQIGGLALYLYALGMGLPLMGFALFGHKLMPKAGAWMQYVKESFGFIILALPLFLLERFVPAQISELLWALLITAFIAWALFIALQSQKPRARIVQIGLCLILLISAYPLQQVAWQMITQKTGFYLLATPQGNSHQAELKFIDVVTLEQLNEELMTSQETNQMVLLDFYADWCAACKQFEKYTFSDQKVQELLKNTKLIRLDVTENTDANTALLANYDILGLPAILIIDGKGEEKTRINGFLSAQKFISQIKTFYLN